MTETQKIMSPCFPAGECSLRLSVYQSQVVRAAAVRSSALVFQPANVHQNRPSAPSWTVRLTVASPNRFLSRQGGSEHLSMCLESKDTEKPAGGAERSCWCLFRLSVLAEAGTSGRGALHRDSYGARPENDHAQPRSSPPPAVISPAHRGWSCAGADLVWHVPLSPRPLRIRHKIRRQCLSGLERLYAHG